MNNLQVFINEEFGRVKQIEEMRSNDYMGFVYALEWDNIIKIGCTKHPYERLLALQRQAENYGNVKLGSFALSKEHTNYRKNEKKLHNHFYDYCKENTELFDISLQQAVTAFSSCLEFLDESETIRRREKATFGLLQHLLLGDSQINNLQTSNNEEFENSNTHIDRFKNATLPEFTNFLHEMSSFLKEMDRVMRDQNSHPSDIAEEFKSVCEQFGIVELSENFVKEPTIEHHTEFYSKKSPFNTDEQAFRRFVTIGTKEEMDKFYSLVREKNLSREDLTVILHAVKLNPDNENYSTK